MVGKWGKGGGRARRVTVPRAMLQVFPQGRCMVEAIKLLTAAGGIQEIHLLIAHQLERIHVPPLQGIRANLDVLLPRHSSQNSTCLSRGLLLAVGVAK